MKHIKRILSLLLAAMLAAGMLAPATQALGSSEKINENGGVAGLFEYYNNTEGWTPLTGPFWRVYNKNAVAYCLDSAAAQPSLVDYTALNPSAVYSAAVQNGLRAILMYGAPNQPAGLDPSYARYTTQMAIWTWMYEQAGVGHALYAHERVRPSEGYEKYGAYYLQLLDKAANNAQVGDFAISASPSTVTLTENGHGQLTGTTTVSFTNLNGQYRIDQSKVPTGVGVYGNTMQHGDVVTIIAPSSYAGQSISMLDVLVGQDMRSAANVFWYESPGYQNMIVLNMELQAVARTNIQFTSELPTSTLRIEKTVSGTESRAGFQFEVRNESGTLIGTYTTGSTGIIDIPDLPVGMYSVREINIPAGFVLQGSNPKNLPIFADAIVAVEFRNVLQQGEITIHKVNANNSMGDYPLAGAVFEIYSGTTLTDTITTDAQGKATSKQLPLGSYIVREKTAPEGYVRNPASYPITLSAGNSTAEVIVGEVTVGEQPQPGRININKSNASPSLGTYSLAGAVFGIYDSSGNSLLDTVTTTADGKAQSKDLPLGTYVVKEITAPYGFVRNTNSFNAPLTYAGQVIAYATQTVDVSEQPQSGIIRVHKTNSNPSMGDYALNGAVFEVRNSGGALVDTITTNAAGLAQTKALPLGQYKITEKTAPYGFVLNANEFTATLTYAGQEISTVYADVTVPERPQTGTIRVTKLDKSTGAAAQGDATLNGAVFEVFASNKTTLMDTLYCGTSSAATSRELPLGTYYYREKIPPTGYLHDPAFYEVKIEYAGQNVTTVEKTGDVQNQVILGQIALTKHTDQPMEGYDDPQIEQPLEGAVFEVYLKSAGSYASAKATERDRITTNSNGYAITKDLPFGVYTVHEISAPGDVKLVSPFDVFISADGKVYRFILNDPAFISLVKIIKTDAETGKPIPLQGTSFKVKDLSTGQWVKQHINYPTPMDLDVFETAADGTLVLPSALKSGNYELVEQCAPRGYLLSSTPIPFTIHSSQATPEMIEVTVPNQPVKGIIKLEKTGDVLVGVQEIETEFGAQYQPVYAPAGVSGAVFSVIAAEDIKTPDGTVRYTKGTVVDTLTTNASGKAESKQLYLGNYELWETKIPEPFILDNKTHMVSLVYENQEVAVISSPITIHNTRQQISIDLQKLMERPVDAPDGFNAFKDVTFGVFADEAFKANDGSVVIPKGELVALLTVDDNGKGTLPGNLPFGKYFVQELKTNAYYRLEEKKYPLNAVYAGAEKAVAHIEVHNGGIALPNELKLGKLTILKQGEQLVGVTQTEEDGYTVNQPQYELRGLPGAKFNVVAGQDIYNVYGKRIYQKGDLMDTVTTGEDGRATTKLLPLARYELVELESPAGYVLLEQPQKVKLGIEDSVLTKIVSKEVTVINQRTRAKLNLSKAAEKPEGVSQSFDPYKDILFGLYAAENLLDSSGSLAIPADTLLEVLRFDVKGHTEIKTDLPYGKFYVKELQTAAGYALDETKYPFQFQSDSGAAVVSIDVNDGNPVPNKLQRGSLEIIKTFESKTTPIAGVPFTITGKTAIGTEYRGEFVTDKDGKITVENLLVGEYTVEELDSKLTAGYILSEKQTITVTADEIARMTIENSAQRGSLKVIKTFEGKTTPLVGVPFLITGKTVIEQEFSARCVTDEKGEIKLDGLLVGDYTVEELQTDLTLGYVLSEAQTIAVAHEKIAELKINNKLQRGDLKIIKSFEEREEPIAGVPFTVEGTSLAGIPFSQEFKTDKNGVILIEGLPVGQYTVRELDDKLTEGYILSKTQTAIVAADQLTELKIDNKLQRGNLKIIKTFEGLELPLAHIPFIVEGTSKTGVKFSETLYTDTEGIILVEGLPIGSYTIRELNSDLTVGYVLSEEKTMTVKADATTEAAIENKLQRGNLKIIKTFEGMDKPVEGVPFRVIGKSLTGAEYEKTFKTDKNGEILVEGLPIGDYMVQELESDLIKGYTLADAQTVLIKAGETTKLAIENKRNRGKVMLFKVDADNPDVRLEDAVFEVYEDTNGNGRFGRRDQLVGTMTETELGVHTMEDLPAGGYFVVEKKAPAGYVLDEKAHYFEITGQDEAVIVENVPGIGFVNASRVGNLRILKSSSDGKKEGFTFRVEGENYDETFVTDAKGEIFIENMRLGTYIITEVETEATAGYKIPDPITVELVENETLRVDIFNEKVTITREPPPKTGDSWLIAGLALAGLLATGSTAIVMLKRRRKEDLPDETTV